MMGSRRRVGARRDANEDRARDDAHRGLRRGVGTGCEGGDSGEKRQERRRGSAHRKEVRRVISKRETRHASDRQWNGKEGGRRAHGTRSCKTRNP